MGRPYRSVSLREASLNTQFHFLTLDDANPKPAPIAEADESVTPLVPSSDPKTETRLPQTPSQIPKAIPRVAFPAEIPSPSKSPQKTPKALPKYLNRESNLTIAFDTDQRLEEVENMCSQFKEKMDGATTESKSLKEMMAVYKIRSMPVFLTIVIITLKWASHRT